MKLKILRETTTYNKVDYDVPLHDYLVEGGHGGRLIAYRKAGSDEWMKFNKLHFFSKKHRTFKELREEVPKEFVKPMQTDPWEKKSYVNLEMFV